jgi:hypothetical protein
MNDFDSLCFDIELAIKLDGAVPRSKRDRSEWAEYVAGKIAARLRRNWDFIHKPAIEVAAAKWPYCRKES